MSLVTGGTCTRFYLCDININRTMKITIIFLFAFLGYVYANSHATPSEQCSGESFDDLRNRIEVTPCGKTRCKLRRGHDVTVTFKFKTEHEVKHLVNEVNAQIVGIPLPFIGVDGTSACAQVMRADNGEPAPCPLAANTEYKYRNVFPVEQFYPTVPIRVHWSLRGDKGTVFCFEVPAIIV